jgi:catechol 2,3-dioxygenase
MKIHPQTHIGHVHLHVADLERAIKFYRDLLGFDVVTMYGDSAAFLSAGGYHHHIGLNTWAGKDATPPPAGHTGLYHFAILLPSRKELAKVLKNLIDHKYPIQGASDHGVSEAIYLADPDENGIELYVDRPRDKWPKDSSGNLAMTSLPLDLDNLLAEIE